MAAWCRSRWQQPFLIGRCHFWGLNFPPPKKKNNGQGNLGKLFLVFFLWQHFLARKRAVSWAVAEETLKNQLFKSLSIYKTTHRNQSIDRIGTSPFFRSSVVYFQSRPARLPHQKSSFGSSLFPQKSLTSDCASSSRTCATSQHQHPAVPEMESNSLPCQTPPKIISAFEKNKRKKISGNF